jgi:nicotinamide riboside transporter PnuC
MSRPGNIIRFEALLLASLLIDTLSAAFNRMALDDVPADDRGGLLIFAITFLIFILTLIRLAAERAQRWALWTLTVLFSLSVLASLAELGEKGIKLSTPIDWLSIALTAYGLYFAFTGNARDWLAGRRSF